MIELDGDEVRISSRGRYAERDIVQVDLFFLSLQPFPTCFFLLFFLFNVIFFFYCLPKLNHFQDNELVLPLNSTSFFFFLMIYMKRDPNFDSRLH